MNRLYFRLLLAAAMLLALCMGSSRAQQVPFDRSKKIVSSGTGFLIDQSGIVVTNYHVVQKQQDVEARLPKANKTYKAAVILKDVTNDIVILKLEAFNYSEVYSTKIPYSIISTKKSGVAQRVYTLGYPLGEVLGESAKYSTGAINSIFGIMDDPRVYQISNPIQPGNSGGPLFNEQGEIIGIVVASLNAKLLFENANILPQNVNFAIKSEYLINLIKMLDDGDRILNIKSDLLNSDVENQIGRIAPFIFQIYSLSENENNIVHNDAIILPEGSLREMVDTTILDLAIAIKAKDFKGFYKTIAKLWKEQTTPEDLAKSFRSFTDQNLDLTVLQALDPIFTKAPALDENDWIMVEGYYPSKPSRAYFTMKFLNEDGVWKLGAVDLNVTPEKH